MFLQIIDFHTDRIDEFTDLEHKWEVATTGERTSVGGQLFADRKNPGHYVALDWFTDYDTAMENSALPATDAFAREAMALSTGDVVFHDLEPATEVFVQGADDLRHGLESGSLPRHAFTEDVELDMVVPHGRVRVNGIDVMEAGLAEEGPGRTFDRWLVQPTPTGFVAEYAYRTTGEGSTLSVGSLIAYVHAGRISRMFVTCGGNWTVEAEAAIREESGSDGVLS